MTNELTPEEIKELLKVVHDPIFPETFEDDVQEYFLKKYLEEIKNET